MYDNELKQTVIDSTFDDSDWLTSPKFVSSEDKTFFVVWSSKVNDVKQLETLRNLEALHEC